MKAFVFDIGNVLVTWDPALAWIDDLGRDGAEAFLKRVDFPARNLRGDAGERFIDMADEIEDSEDRARLRQYVERYPVTVPAKVAGTWQIMERLRAKGYQIHAITNWSAETWPQGIKAHPELGTSFGVTIVSGQEKMLKPQPEIFKLLCERAGLEPQDCVFIDDGPRNVAGAQAVGMQAIHFTDATALEGELMARGWL